MEICCLQVGVLESLAATLSLSEAIDIQTVKELVKHTDKLCCLFGLLPNL